MSAAALLTAPPLAGWQIDRPWAAGLLLLPLALLLLSLRRAEQRTVLLGTARFFDPLAAGEGRERRRRLSAARVLAALAMVAAVVGVAGPSPPAAPAARPLVRVVLDRSPSMFLPVDPARPAGDRRIDAAVAAAGAELRRAGDGADVDYVDGSRFPEVPAVRVEGGGPPPAAWLRRPTAALPPPPAALAGAGPTLLLTDRRPRPRPDGVGLVLSGGAAVPGPVAWGPDGALVWSGAEGDPLEADPRRRPRLRIEGELDPHLEAMVRTWALDRGVRADGDAGGSAELTVRALAPAGAAERVAGGRDGWRASGSAAPGRPSGAPWWTDAAGRVLAASAPGRLEFVSLALDGAPAPPDAFAVSMAALLDRALLDPPWLVPLDERRAAEGPLVELPAAGAAGNGEPLRGRGAARRGALALCAALAAALGAASAVLRARGSA